MCHLIFVMLVDYLAESGWPKFDRFIFLIINKMSDFRRIRYKMSSWYILSFKEKLLWFELVTALCCSIQDTALKGLQLEFSSAVFSDKFY